MNIDLQAREITPLRHTYAHVARHIGGDKTASRYQEATMGAQPSTNFHYRPTWDPQHELFDTSRSAVTGPAGIGNTFETSRASTIEPFTRSPRVEG